MLNFGGLCRARRNVTDRDANKEASYGALEASC